MKKNFWLPPKNGTNLYLKSDFSWNDRFDLGFHDRKNIQILLKSHFSNPDDMVSDKLLENLIYLPFSDLADDEESMGNVYILMGKKLKVILDSI